MSEVWKDIEGYEGLYQVSNQGNVKSLNHRGTGKERILSKTFDPNGYWMVGLRKDGKTKLRMVHRLVAEAFIPNHDNKPCVNHINTIRTDNRLENLCWATHKEASNNPITRERSKKSLGIKVFCEGTVFNSITECAEHYGVKKGTMYKWLDGTRPMPVDFYRKGLGFSIPSVQKCNSK